MSIVSINLDSFGHVRLHGECPILASAIAGRTPMLGSASFRQIGQIIHWATVPLAFRGLVDAACQHR